MSFDIIIDPTGKKHKVHGWGYDDGTEWSISEGLCEEPWGNEVDTYSIELKEGLYAVIVNDTLVEVSDAVHNFKARTNHFDNHGNPKKYAGAVDQDFWTKTENILRVAPRTLLYGVPGTGKTTTAFLVDPERTDKVTLTEETPASALLGHWMPEGDHFKWHDGIAISAWRRGRRLLVDEIDRGSGDVQTLMYAIADDPMVARLTLPTGEVVKPEPGFQVVITMNGQPNDLPPALQDRFATQIEVDRPHPKAISSLPEDLRGVAENAFSLPGERSASIRAWKAFAELREQTNEETAAFGVFGRRAAEFLNVVRMSRSTS